MADHTGSTRGVRTSVITLDTFTLGSEVALPNRRLTLAGAARPKGSGGFVPWRARTFVQRPCAGGRVARSLSAIR